MGHISKALFRKKWQEQCKLRFSERRRSRTRKRKSAFQNKPTNPPQCSSCIVFASALRVITTLIWAQCSVVMVWGLRMHAVFHATAHIQTPLYNLCVFLCTIPCPYFTGCQEWFHQVCIELSSEAYVAASVNIFSDFDSVPSASPLLAKNLFSTMNCSNKNLGIVKRVPKARPPLNSMSIFQKSKMMHASCHRECKLSNQILQPYSTLKTLKNPSSPAGSISPISTEHDWSSPFACSPICMCILEDSDSNVLQ